MAILEGGHIVPPPRTQATSRSPAPLGLKDDTLISFQSTFRKITGNPVKHSCSCLYSVCRCRVSMIAYFVNFNGKCTDKRFDGSRMSCPPNYFIRIIIALANNRLIIAPVNSTKSKSLNRIGNLKFGLI